MRLTSSRAYTGPTPVPKMPPGLVELMEGLTRDVLKNNPTNVYEFCANHMEKLLEIRDGASTKKVTLNQKVLKAQEIVRQTARERQERFDAEVNLQTSSNEETIKSDEAKNVPTTLILKAPVHHECDLEHASEVEISLAPNAEKVPFCGVSDPSQAGLSGMIVDTHATTNDNLKKSNTQKLEEETIFGIIEKDILNVEILKEPEIFGAIQNETSESHLKTITEESHIGDRTVILPEITIDDEHVKLDNNAKNKLQDPSEVLMKSDKNMIVNETLTLEIETDNKQEEPVDLLQNKTEDIQTNSCKKLLQTDSELQNESADLFNNKCESLSQSSGEDLTQTKSEDFQINSEIAQNTFENLPNKSEDLIQNESENLHQIVSEKQSHNMTKSVACISETTNSEPFANVEQLVDVVSLENIVSDETVAETDNVTCNKNIPEGLSATEGDENNKAAGPIPNITSTSSCTDKDLNDIDVQTTNDSKHINSDEPNIRKICIDSSSHELDCDKTKDNGTPNVESSNHSSRSNLIDSVEETAESKSDVEIKSNDEVKIKENVITSEVQGCEKNEIDKDCKISNETQLVEPCEEKQNIDESHDNCTEMLAHKSDSAQNTNEDSVSIVESDVSKIDDDFLQTHPNDMNLESAAVTIQKVFRSFMFKNRNSTFEDNVNGEHTSTDEDHDKKEEYYAAANLNKERRPLGITRMDTVLQTVNEEKSLSLSTDDSSTLSSAATTIQAHVRGFLVRNRLNSSKTFSMNSLANSHEFQESDTEQQKNKTVLNIHIVPEEGNYLSRDESLFTSMDLSLDGSPPSSVNLHPLSQDISERRKMLKREDAIQSVSPPSNNSGKLSEDSVKEVLINENGVLDRDLSDDKVNELEDQSQSKELDIVSKDILTSTSTVTPTTIITVSKSEEPLKSPREYDVADLQRNGRSFTKMSSDESDVITPFVSSPRISSDGDNNTRLVHSGEFHDVVLPTKVSRCDTSVVREFKTVLVYFLFWNN